MKHPDHTDHYQYLSSGLRLAKDEMLRLSKDLIMTDDMIQKNMFAVAIDEYERMIEDWRVNCTDQ